MVTLIAYGNVCFSQEMSRVTAILIAIVAICYLVFGLAEWIAPGIFLLLAPRRAFTREFVFSQAILWYIGYKILTTGTWFFIAYALIRHKKWGRYLLILNNVSWLGYLTYAFIAQLINEPSSVGGSTLVGTLISCLILGVLIAFACQKDVKALVAA